jgi:hypothetical protein
MEYEEVWGISIPDLVTRDWRHQSQYSQHRQPQSRPEHRNSVTSPIAIRPQHRDNTESATSFRPPSPSPLPSLGRSFDELRLHNRPLHADSRSSGTTHDHRERESRRTISDADIDPALQGGPQSLPSLKASGLLDSWNTGKEGSMAGPWSANTYLRSDVQHQPPLRRQSPARRETPTSAGSHYTHYDTDPSRVATNGMPVGMSWLANESR